MILKQKSGSWGQLCEARDSKEARYWVQRRLEQQWLCAQSIQRQNILDCQKWFQGHTKLSHNSWHERDGLWLCWPGQIYSDCPVEM